MFYIRPVRSSDLKAVEHLAISAGPGLSLPTERSHLRLLLQESALSFEKRPLSPGPESYFFVLEEAETGKVIGCCAIHAKTGGYLPLCLYEIVNVNRTSPITRKKSVLTRLHPKQIHDGPSELCTLYILPHYRSRGLGHLLSFSRLLFIATFPKRFDTTLSALMRPYVGPDGHSPFWQACGARFFGMDFLAVSRLRYTRPRLLEGLLPRYPVYASLLPQTVQDSIGQVHAHTLPAVKMLEEQGFHKTNLVDAFDGGPLYSASTAEVRAIRSSMQAKVAKLHDRPPRSRLYIVSNQSIDFRACLTTLHQTKDGVAISREAAMVLQVNVGDPLLYYPITGRRSK
jgi:arginine N-succinyltransferase